MDILKSVLDWFNTPAGVAVIAAVVLYALNYIYAKKPLWQQYEGTIISAIKMAEKTIPDDSENKSVARLDAALKYVLTVYEGVKKRQATEKELAEIKDGISLIHSNLESENLL